MKFIYVLITAIALIGVSSCAAVQSVHHGKRYDARVSYIKFDFDKNDLKDSIKFLVKAKVLLDTFITETEARHGKDYKVGVVGRTDYKGSDEYNVHLGLRRAKAVAKYLESKGVDVFLVESSGETDDVVTEPYIAQNVPGIGTRETNRSITLIILH